ncbi:MAG: hypothetical protein JSS94_09110 [Bacteroidetes bacterium]|nr:hypothetical protein [Bacteroidota bacterium]
MHLKLFLLAGIFLVFSSCNNSSNPNDGREVVHHTVSDNEHQVRSDSSELALNNGAKWQTDASTRTHAQALNKLSEEFEKASKNGLDTYHAFADKAQNELQELINGCTMKGPDHDALHLWLEPVLADVKNLKNSDNTNEAEIAVNSFFSNVKKFNQFFN